MRSHLTRFGRLTAIGLATFALGGTHVRPKKGKAPPPNIVAATNAYLGLGPRTVVAHIGKRPIRLADVDAEIPRTPHIVRLPVDPEMHQQAWAPNDLSKPATALMVRVWDLRQRALERIIERDLLEAAARSEGKTSDWRAWTRAKVEGKTSPPDADQVRFVVGDLLGDERKQSPAATAIVRRSLHRSDLQASYAKLVLALERRARIQRSLPVLRRKVATGDRVWARKGAKVTVVEFGNGFCRGCGDVERHLSGFMPKGLAASGAPSKIPPIRVAYRLVPVPGSSEIMNEAVECAPPKGRPPLAYLDDLFGLLGTGEEDGAGNVIRRPTISGLARIAGHTDRFHQFVPDRDIARCLRSHRMAAKVRRDGRAAAKQGVHSVPTVVVDGIRLSGNLPFADFPQGLFEEVLDEETSRVQGRSATWAPNRRSPLGAPKRGPYDRIVGHPQPDPLVPVPRAGRPGSGAWTAVLAAADHRIGVTSASVVGHVDGRAITLGEVDVAAKPELRHTILRYVDQVQMLRQLALHHLLARKLLGPEPRHAKRDERFLEQRDEKLVRREKQARVTIDWGALRVFVEAPGGAELPTAPVALGSLGLHVPLAAPARGPKDAPVTIVAFDDHVCDACHWADDAIARVLEHYGKKVRLVSWPWPVSDSPTERALAEGKAEARACARAQGRYRTFVAQEAKARGLTLGRVAYEYVASKVAGLDLKAFDACLERHEMTPSLESAVDVAKAAGAGTTPTFFIDGFAISGAVPYPLFTRIIDRALGKRGKRPAHGGK